MCEIQNDWPYIYMLELHIGDGYFDRQSIGEYTVLINYTYNKNMIIKEKERGDDRLVKFRQGRSVIFGITKPSDILQIIFQAFDNNKEIGNSSIYFIDVGAPNNLAEKSMIAPIASCIQTNVQLSHSAGSLQIFARLTCFGHNLLTEFIASNDVNTEFDALVNDIGASTDENFTKYEFHIDNVNNAKEIPIASHTVNDEHEQQQQPQVPMPPLKLPEDTLINPVSNQCFYESSNTLIAASEQYLKHNYTINNDNHINNINNTVDDIIEQNVNEMTYDNNNTVAIKEIRDLDDLMFTNFITADEQQNYQENELIDKPQSCSLSEKTSASAISADNSMLDLKDYLSDNFTTISEDPTIVDDNDLCVESKIGDAPINIDNNEKIDNDLDKKKDENEIGDGPISSDKDSINNSNSNSKQNKKKRSKHQKRINKNVDVNKKPSETGVVEDVKRYNPEAGGNRKRKSKGRKKKTISNN